MAALQLAMDLSCHHCSLRCCQCLVHTALASCSGNSWWVSAWKDLLSNQEASLAVNSLCEPCSMTLHKVGWLEKTSHLSSWWQISQTTWYIASQQDDTTYVCQPFSFVVDSSWPLHFGGRRWHPNSPPWTAAQMWCSWNISQIDINRLEKCRIGNHGYISQESETMTIFVKLKRLPVETSGHSLRKPIQFRSDSNLGKC